MPHCVLEHSANVLDRPDYRRLFLELHQALEATGEFRLADMKSRAVVNERFVVEDGSPDRAFVALRIAILEGRSDALKAQVSDTALLLLKAFFPKSLATGRCSFSVEVADMHRASYRRQTAPD